MSPKAQLRDWTTTKNQRICNQTTKNPQSNLKESFLRVLMVDVKKFLASSNVLLSQNVICNVNFLVFSSLPSCNILKSLSSKTEKNTVMNLYVHTCTLKIVKYLNTFNFNQFFQSIIIQQWTVKILNNPTLNTLIILKPYLTEIKPPKLTIFLFYCDINDLKQWQQNKTKIINCTWNGDKTFRGLQCSIKFLSEKKIWTFYYIQPGWHSFSEKSRNIATPKSYTFDVF